MYSSSKMSIEISCHTFTLLKIKNQLRDIERMFILILTIQIQS